MNGLLPSEITGIRAREVLDSRGNPTVEVDVMLASGHRGRASVPSGASTGSLEARELRDEDPLRYRGKGVLTAVSHVTERIAPTLLGWDAREQPAIDAHLIELDGTDNKEELGANAILGTSMAVAYAAAAQLGTPLYQRLAGEAPMSLPVPLMNVLNGGQHAANNVNVQEFMIVPAGAPSFREALRWGAEIYHALKDLLLAEGLTSTVGDEGGYAPDLADDEAALTYLVGAIERAGYRPGEDVWLALDVAASELVEGEHYRFRGEVLKAVDLTRLYRRWADQYPIISIEDGLGEQDWHGWQFMTEQLGDGLQLVGDDLFVTNPRILRRGHDEGLANAILIKPNQIGTVTETLETLNLARSLSYAACVSHRSGETGNTFIADLAVAAGMGQIKTGAPCRSDRVEKYNQLLRIEEELGENAVFAGLSAFMLE